MKKPLFLAASALFVMIGAAHPDTPKLAYDGGIATSEDAPAPVRYRPCRRGPGDDRCIQLYERGVRAAYARWLRGKDAAESEARLAQGGPYQPRPDHRARHAHDERCVASPDADAVRGM